MLLTGTDHASCPRSAHRTIADPDLHETTVEDTDPLSGTTGTGRMCCSHCRKPLAHCSRVAAANQGGREYERAYFHPDRRDEENCP